VSYPLENALFQWEEGWRTLQELRHDPAATRRADRVVAAVHDELRRRIGPTFRAAELAELYAQDTDWPLEVVLAASPQTPLEPRALIDAAFWLYLRRATDYSGGRQLAFD
jgi:hypothetical protein